MNLGTWLDTMRAASIPSVSSQVRQHRKLGSKKEMNDLLVPGLSKRDKKQRAGSDVGEVYPTVKAYGTSEGVRKAWMTRGTGRSPYDHGEVAKKYGFDGPFSSVYDSQHGIAHYTRDKHDVRVTRKGQWEHNVFGSPIEPTRGRTSEGLSEHLAKYFKPDVKAYGTSEGVSKSWDTRGRGRFKVGMFVKHPLSAVPSKVIALHKNAIELESQTPGAKQRVRLPYTHPMVKGLKESEPPKIRSWKTRTTKHAYLDEGYGE